MIRITDATILAFTKLRTRRIRLIITVVISSLILAVLVFGLIVTAGTFKSIDDFRQQGLNNRYLVSLSYMSSWDGIDTNQSIINRAKELHAQQLVQKQAIAKKLGTTFDPAVEEGVFLPAVYKDGPEYFNYANPAVQKAIDEYFESVPYNWAVIDRLQKQYSATAVYPLETYFSGFSVREMKNGVEKFGEQPPVTVGDPTKWPFSIRGLDDSLARPFEFDAATITKNKPLNESIPVVVPYSYAEKLAGFEKLSPTASSQEKLDRIERVREKAPTLRPVGCYRNYASEQLVTLALGDVKEAARNKDNKDYKTPDITHTLPDQTSCGAITIVDKRSKAVKELEQKQKQLSIEAGLQSKLEMEPVQHKVPFQIVGIAPDAPTATEGLSLTRLMSTVAGSNLNNEWIIPNHLRANAGALLPPIDMTEMPELYIFEFTSSDAAQKFINTVKCPLSTCDGPKRTFQVQQMGSNSIIVNDLRRMATEGLLLIGLGVVILASIIMMGNIGRMITDSRRETAVFRAIGAKRLDIAYIYLIYVMMVALLIATVGYGVGLCAALYGNTILGPEATAQALLNFGTADMGKLFSLIDIRSTDLLIVVGLSLLAGFIGSIIPLLRNIRRSPIRDMRDE